MLEIHLNALADFLIEEIDCSAEYEEDCFGLTFRGYRLYVERRRMHFRIEHGAAVFELPRP
ncbi:MULTISPECIES: hypothetical protein [Sphingobium]|uniref:Uncharacterized protein n=1 Tax=Sphingobium fuliginis ATCC 27551 TaxID=1208342 RepID=A0A5B8CKB3_SPHSA|nr:MULTISPECIES: hypothetical protein [Sphingobium]QDC38690.1 hypothetical protein FIL70_17005 [Sphingobium fuliginis ATCC 27551]